MESVLVSDVDSITHMLSVAYPHEKGKKWIFPLLFQLLLLIREFDTVSPWIFGNEKIFS